MIRVMQMMLKELTVVMRDRTALLLMFGLPLSLTLVIAFAFGTGDDGGTTLSDIPLVVIDNDGGDLGQALVDVYFSDDLADLLEPELGTDEATALARLAADEIAAVVVIPDGLSDRVSGGGVGPQGEPDQATPAEILVTGNPVRPVSSGVVSAVTEQFAQTVNTGSVGVAVTFQQLIATGRLSPAEAQTGGAVLGEAIVTGMVDAQLLTLERAEAESEGENPFTGGFNWLAFAAPSMALLGLMFSMTGSARSILVERQEGTLARLRTAPISPVQIITGKALGTFVTGLLQMAILIGVTWVALQVVWGDLLSVVVFTVLVVAAIASLGMLVAAFATSAAQANAMGTAVVLILSAVSGTFIPRSQFPVWLQQVSKVGPVAWALDGFDKLSGGATLVDLGPELVALGAMTVVFLGVAVWGYRRVLR